MAEAYPQIDPTTFDLVIVGTGLPESLIAAAASSAGKSVLHLDPNPFYGSHFASLSPDDLSSFLSSNSCPSSSSPPGDDPATSSLATRPLYSHVEISSFAPEIIEEHSRKFNLDLAGPRVLFCADKAVDAILKFGTNHYLEFKAIDANFICVERGKFMRVPDSRSAIFKDKNLSLMEKNQLMKFFKLVQQHLDPDEDGSSRVSDEDLESPFAEFLGKIGLPQKIKSIIMYSIAMADHDQENVDVEISKEVLRTKDGIDRLALFHASVGRFPNAAGALIYPSYGQGELPQSFCRRAAVKSCLHVLRMPAVALHIDKDNGQYKGIRLASGQDIFSSRLVLDPSYVVPQQVGSEPVQNLSQRDVEAKLARGVCVTRASLIPDISNLVLVYPPRSLYPEQDTAVRVLQLGSTSAVCPPGMFLLYLSTYCNDVSQGKNLLDAAISDIEVSHIYERNAGNANEDAEVEKPFILWKATYIQQLSMGKYGSISSTPSADGNLNYNDLVDATEKLFHSIYPNDAFFPETTSPENTEDDVPFDEESAAQ